MDQAGGPSLPEHRRDIPKRPRKGKAAVVKANYVWLYCIVRCFMCICFCILNCFYNFAA